MSTTPFIAKRPMSMAEAYKYFNNYDIAKYINNLSYYQYTSKFKPDQENYIKKLLIFIVPLSVLFFVLFVVQFILCIFYLPATNNLSAIGIALAIFWVLGAVCLVSIMHWNAKRYYKVIDFLMGQGSLNPVAIDYPRIVYTMLWYFHTKPMWGMQWVGVNGLVMQTWVGYNKSLGLFIDKLNQFYLAHQNDPTIPKDNNSPKVDASAINTDEAVKWAKEWEDIKESATSTLPTNDASNHTN